MNILVLHGPNINLIGVRSAQVGKQVTLDKIDRALRKTAHDIDLEITLKIVQTHYVGKAITFLQRNRKWADGLIISPGPWAKANYDLLDTLKLIRIPTIELFFDTDFDPDKYSKTSIFSNFAIETQIDSPLEVYISALTRLYSNVASKKI